MQEIDNDGKQPSDPSTTQRTDRASLRELFEQVSGEFGAAVGTKNGWGWKHVSWAIHLYDASTKLRRWRDSVRDLAADFYGVESTIKNNDTTEDKFHEFLTHVECDRPYLSGTIRLYLDDLLDVVRSVHTMQKGRTQDSE
jgi:hypothetical protein